MHTHIAQRHFALYGASHGAEPESDLELYLCTRALDYGGLAIKVAGYGMPDRLLINLSPPVFVELKRRGALPAEHQVGMMRCLRDRGFPAFWLNTRAEIDGLFRASLAGELIDDETGRVLSWPLKFGGPW